MSDAYDFDDDFNPAEPFELPEELRLEDETEAPLPPQDLTAPSVMIADELPAFGYAEAPPLDDPVGYDEPVFSTPADSVGQPIPHISIRAFCERPDTVALIESAAQDRRMARANVEASLGGLSEAIEYFQDENTPNLILIESGMRGQVLFDQLEALANVCDAGTKVIIIGAANDIGLYRQLIRRGISDYLVPPLSALQLISAIADIYVDPDQPFAGKVTAFIGAKGGVGASTLAHNVAWQISEGARAGTTIVDLDLSFGTAGLDFNQESNSNIGDALAEPDRVDDVLLERLLVKCTEHLSIFTAPATLDREWELDPAAYETVISQVRAMVPHVILDLPHTWTSWVKSTLFAADDIVIVASPDLASLRNAKNLYDLAKATRANDSPPMIVVNQVGVPKRPEIPIKDFTDALGAEPVLVLAFEPQIFGEAANNGQMIQEIKADSKAADGLAHLAGLLIGQPCISRKTGFLQKLLRKG
ncbi:MAG: pilus assembly protein CpaE [Robiginitomaculum sp.]|nr:MAG: pilus assembly protein CpaE [Robiginitomaculum sp.]